MNEPRPGSATRQPGAPRVVNLFSNQSAFSREIGTRIQEIFEREGFVVAERYDSGAELIVSIGGDGALLKALHELDFPDIPFLGVNTGHLGFFQELYPDDLEQFLVWYKEGRYTTQVMKTVQAEVSAGGREYHYTGLNEIVLRASPAHAVHLDISIGGNFIERFSGDGLLVCTPAGSTAYNYALGGSIIDPRLALLQITPMAPMNTTAYRSFTSSLAVPPDLPIRIRPEAGLRQPLVIVLDGIMHSHPDLQEVRLGYSPIEVKLLRFEHYDFWSKVKSKFL